MPMGLRPGDLLPSRPGDLRPSRPGDLRPSTRRGDLIPPPPRGLPGGERDRGPGDRRSLLGLIKDNFNKMEILYFNILFDGQVFL